MSEHTSPYEASSTLPTESLVGREEKDPNVVTSVSDFIAKIAPILEECDGTEIFYRGHADENWKLQPSILRGPRGIENEHLLFRDMVARLPQSFSGCKSALDYLVQMQHYELPTRLLDVTMNPLVALYFACQSVENLEAGTLAGLVAGGSILFDFCRNLPANTLRDDHITALIPEIAMLAGALAGAAVPIAGDRGAAALATAILVSDDKFKDCDPSTKSRILSCAKAAAKAAARAGAKAGTKARSGNGVIYLFSVPNDSVKHYDSDTVSILANLAKCSDREIDIYTEQTKGVVKSKVLEKFNKRDGIQILLRQIKEEKPYFEPLIRPNDLSSIFLVKAKYGNPRIINQAGAFFIFGLGLNPSSIGSGGRLTKRGDHEIPSAWIRHKFIIPKDKKQGILDELARMGITESYLFPEMDKYAKELKKKYELS